MSGQPEFPFGVLDLPAEGQRVDGLLTIQGWVLSRENDAVDIIIRLGDRMVGPVTRSVRPDVSRQFPSHAESNPFPGFNAVALTRDIPDGRYPLTCELHAGDGVHVLATLKIDVRNSRRSAFYHRIYTENSAERKDGKLALMTGILACPHCRAGLSAESGKTLACRDCGEVGFIKGGVPFFGVPEQDAIVSQGSIPGETSSHPYPQSVLDRLEEVCESGGLALDLGSGSRLYGSEKLVQLEIAPYPFTDVVSRTERLPFLDESFDFVFSISTMEHIRKPWIMAEEIQRVLKAEGLVHIETAFLQPFHGYPSHYFNMSDQALKDLFPRIDIVFLGPEKNQLPWFSLRWMVDSLLRDLPPRERELISNMPLGRLSIEMNRYASGLPSRLDSIRLSTELKRELAAGHTLIGRRRPRK